MTILQVWGKVDSNDVICSPVNDKDWTVIVPPDLNDGCYICEFWALSNNGLVGYRSAVLWIVDGRLTCIKWLDETFYIQYVPNDYDTQETSDSEIYLLGNYELYTLDDYSLHFIGPRCSN